MRVSSALLLAASWSAVAAAVSAAFTFPVNGVAQWWLDSKADGPNAGCVYLGEATRWVMLSAYRAGGEEGVHWKYTADANDPECLVKWKYYQEDGQTLIATVSGRTTTVDSTMGKWCGLPVYRSGGIEGKQWAYCPDDAPTPTTRPPTIAPTTAPPGSVPTNTTPTPTTGSSSSSSESSSSATTSPQDPQESAAASTSGATTVAPTLTTTTSPPPATTGAASSLDANAKSSESKSSNVPVIVGFAVALVVVVAIIVFVVSRNRKRQRKLSSTPTDFALLGGGGYTTNAMYPQDTRTTAGSSATGSNHKAKHESSFSALIQGTRVDAMGLLSDRSIQSARIPLHKIVLGQELSHGSFGVVFKGSYDGQIVAVKRLVPSRCKDLDEIQSFLEEARLMTTLRHPRIVTLVGIAWESLSDVSVVTDFMAGGDLRGLLSQYSSMNAPMGFNANKVKIAMHIADALSYLHELTPTVLHRDLKSKNILLSGSLDAKLTDFGVSREKLRANASTTVGVGSSLWMAPEVMQGRQYDFKADIFSFAVVLSELDTHQIPYSHAVERFTEAGSSYYLPEIAILQMVAQGELQAAFSRGADPALVEMGRSCLDLNPLNRPSAKDLFKRLQYIFDLYYVGKRQ